MNLIKYKNWFFIFSLALIVPGIIAFFTWGLKLGVDFAGGTLWEVKFEKLIEPAEFSKILEEDGAEIAQVTKTSQETLLVRMKVTEEEKIKQIKEKVKEQIGKNQEIRLETVGPTISKELTQKAVMATAIAIAAIVIYITWAFRKVPKPTSSFAFGICTVFALLHDVVIVIGIFAILGHFFGIEVDSLFITAILTVLGFSVHDTIVVFDRIRENLKKHQTLPFEKIVNQSILQTLTRSLNTSLTVIFVLLAMLLFGGQSIRSFVLALLIGIVSGTYSSIFNAAPLLVIWNNLVTKRKTS